MARRRNFLKFAIIAIYCSSSLVQAGGIDIESTFKHIQPSTDSQAQARAVRGLVDRLIPHRANQFEIVVDPSLLEEGRDVFVLSKSDGDPKVLVRGSSGVAASWGLNHYLKHYCGCQVSWEYAQQLNLPNPLPNVQAKIRAQDRFRYYQNVCTLSYSFAWWKWAQWEKHIDWMALNGINLPLAFVGQEAIWDRVYKSLGFNQSEIDGQLAGPAFFAWGRMGNIRGFGGPLSASWHAQTVELQHNILNRMRELGMTPVLPGFAGFVPQDIVRLYPNVNFTKMARWVNFPDEYCCPYLIPPEEPLFKDIGGMFLRELIAEFGTNHIYNCDTFNEMDPGSGEESYLASVGRATFESMTAVDEQAIWMMQGWLFLSGFWTTSRAEALLTSVPQGRMLVLDLQSELSPLYEKFESYYGQPFIWCMLHNFGGTLGLYGVSENVNLGVFGGRRFPNSTMVGTGMTMEGINQNYVMYDLMAEMGWREAPVKLPNWFADYGTRRYGMQNDNTTQAWKLLQRSVYTFLDDYALLGHRPSLDMHETVWYNASDVVEAWDLLTTTYDQHPSPTLHHDVVDVGRQVMQLLAAHFYTKMVTAYRKNITAEFLENSSLLLRTLSDMDVLLSSSPDFLLDSWVQDARSWGSNKQEADHYEWNARNQISIWGPRGEILDYANKQWAGVLANYFLPRWELFVQELNDSLTTGLPFNQTDFNALVFENAEEPFSLELTPEVSARVAEDADTIPLTIHKKWRPVFKRSVASSFKRQWLKSRKRLRLIQRLSLARRQHKLDYQQLASFY